jgi:hypothetical protein
MSWAAFLLSSGMTGLGVLGLNWQASPALTEVEEVVTDWMRRMTGLSGAWSGVIHDTASTCTLVALMCARERASRYSLARGGLQSEPAPLIVYTSAHSHSSVDKAALLAGFGRDNVRHIPNDGDFALRPDALEAAIREDLAAGRKPCAMVGTTGTTTSTAIDPIAAMANPFWIPNAVHMLLGAYTATGFGAAGLHALALRREPHSEFHRKALRIALSVGAVTALLQPISGDQVARLVHAQQPAKLAALEGQFESVACAPLRIGGFPFPQQGETRYALEIPCGLSLLAAHDPHAVIQGLDAFPPDARPDPRPVHVAFQVMVGIGTLLAALGVWAAWLAWRRGERFSESRAFTAALVGAAPLGFVAIEAGWIVTEMGRQPWIIYGVMRVGEAVTPMPWLGIPLAVIAVLYVGLAYVVVRLMRRELRATREAGR